MQLLYNVFIVITFVLAIVATILITIPYQKKIKVDKKNSKKKETDTENSPTIDTSYPEPLRIAASNCESEIARVSSYRKTAYNHRAYACKACRPNYKKIQSCNSKNFTVPQPMIAEEERELINSVYSK